MTDTGAKTLFSLFLGGGLFLALVSFDYVRRSPGALPQTPVAAASSSAPPLVVADFEEGRPLSRWGEWKPIDDRGLNGISTAQIAVVDGGADHSKRALHVTGTSEIWYFPFPFAGAAAPLGHIEFGAPEPRDVRAYTGLEFWARADGHEYAVRIVSDEVTDWNHHYGTFRPGSDWGRHRIAFRDLQQYKWGKRVPWTGQRISALHFVTHTGPASAVGQFSLRLDQIRFY